MALGKNLGARTNSDEANNQVSEQNNPIANIPMLVLDAKGVIIKSVGDFAKTYDLTIAQLEGKRIDEFVPESDKRNLITLVSATANGLPQCAPFSLDLYGKKSDVYIVLTPSAEKGSVWLTIIPDNQSKKRKLTDLQFELISKSAISIVTDSKWKIMEVSNFFKELTGLAEKKIGNTSIFDLLSGDAKSLIEGAIKNGSKVDIQLFDRNGVLHNALIYIEKIDEGYLLSGTINHSANNQTSDHNSAIEELRATEEELRQNMEEMAATQEALEAKNRENAEMVNYYRQILDAIRYPMFVADMDTKITFMNQAVPDTFGTDTANLIGHKCEGLCTEICNTDKCAIRKLRLGDSKTEFKHGEKIFDVESFFLHDIDGNRIGFIEMLQDATEVRKAKQTADQALTEALNIASQLQTKDLEMQVINANMQGMLNGINNTLIASEYAPDGTLIEANDNYLQTMGYNHNEVIGKNVKIFVRAEDLSNFEAIWKSVLDGNTYRGEVRRKTKSGEDRWLLMTYTPIYNSEQKISKILYLALNITEQKAKTLSDQFQIDAVSKTMLVAHFDLNGKLLTANNLLLSTLGYTNITQQSIDFVSIFDSESKVMAQQLLHQLSIGQNDAGVYKFNDTNYKPLYLQGSFNVIFNLDGNPDKIVFYAYNITQFTLALQASSTFLNDIANGNINTLLDQSNIGNDGDVRLMADNLLKLQGVLQQLLTETDRVAQLAGNQGQLNVRLNLGNVHGAWLQLGQGLNRLLDAVSEPIYAISGLLNQMAEGKLNLNLNIETKGDLRTMADALLKASDGLRHLLLDVEETSKAIAETSEGLRNRSEAMSRSAMESATAIGQMAKGAADQAQRTDESSKLVEQILVNTNELRVKAQSISESAQEGVELGQTGIKAIELVVDTMQAINQSADITSNTIDVLTTRSEDIARTLSVITEIASQTNLLALNAAIEAARAGDAGRGFAVVAEEIRKLAEDSRRSAGDIGQVVRNVQKDVTAAGKAISEMRSSVTQGTKATQSAADAFNKLHQSNNEMASVSVEMLDYTSMQKANVENVVKNIERIVVVAEETAAGTSEVASASVEMKNTVVEVLAQSQRLSEIAEKLQAGLSMFDIK